MSHVVDTNKHISIKEHSNKDKGGKVVHSLYLNSADIKIENAIRFEGTKEKITDSISTLCVERNERKRLRQIISRNCEESITYFFYYEQMSGFFYIISEIPESKDGQLELIFKRDNNSRTKIDKFTTRRIDEKNYSEKAGLFRSYVMDKGSVYEGKFSSSGIHETANNVKATVEHAFKNDMDAQTIIDLVNMTKNTYTEKLEFKLDRTSVVVAVGDDIDGVKVTVKHWLDFKKTFLDEDSREYVSPKMWARNNRDLFEKLRYENSVWIVNHTANGEYADGPKDEKAKQLYAIWL